ADEASASSGDLSLRWVVFGGEALELESLRSWYQRHAEDRPRLVNMYGITETTVHVTYRELTAADAVSGTGSRIGVAIPDLQVYVLDRHQQLVPEGVAGELCVGGAGLAWGYLGRPELTAERFVPHPFAAGPGERLYRSGDLGRWVSGDLEYLGRIDHQVKVRGFRIELGEIESVLGRHEAVRETVVLARGDSGEARLVAYVVFVPGRSATAGELRAFAGQSLPEHMVPSAFVALPALPLTGNGKVDRKALPAPEEDGARLEAGEAFVAPGTREERVLAEVWERVLGVERVGAHDNFFALGGDSILSLQVRSQALEQGVDFALQDLFEHQTIARLAAALTPGSAAAEASPVSVPFGLVPEQDLALLSPGLEDAYPLTRLQAGMLFHSEYSAGSTAYHDLLSYHLRSPFDAAALEQAFAQLVAAHPVLRTSFLLARASEPLQLVHAEVPLPFRVEDLSDRPAAGQEAGIAAFLEAERQRQIPWDQAPLLRVQVHRRSESTFQITLSFHHAILDGWSLASALTELFQRYMALLGKGVPPRPAPALAFREMVAAEREALASAESRQFWLDRVEDAEPASLFGGSAPESGARLPGSRHVGFPAELSAGLAALARAAGVPLKSVLLAAHVRVIGWLAGSDDVLTGLVANGRLETEDGERVLGLFLNTVPFRLRLGGGSWLDLVREAFRREQEHLPHRRYPMAELSRLLGGRSLLETSFNYVHFHVYRALDGFREVELLGSHAVEETSFALVASFSQDVAGGGVQLRLEHDAARFPAGRIEAVGRYYAAALEALVRRPGEIAAESCLLADAERRQLLAVEGAPGAVRPPARSLHEIFERQAARAPEAVAAVCGGRGLVYAELDARANRLARHLLSLGVAPGSRVGLCLERDLELVVAILAVLKAGCAYVPLDGALPAERLAFLLEDSGVQAVVTQESLLDALPETAVPRVCLEREAAAIDARSGDPLRLEVPAGQAAYVIYTSGSTGRPKGVVVSHANVARLFAATEPWFGFGPGDVWTLFHSYAFDFSVWEIWGALLYGGRLVVVPYWESRSPESFLDLLAREKVTVLSQTPSAFRQLMRSEETAGSTRELALRWVVFGGEALELGSLRPWYERHPEDRPRLVNMYGITETTVHVTWRALTAADAAGAAGSRIGVPIPGLQLHVLDRRQNLVPEGVPGELCVGGEGLAWGYLGRPELTAERFVPNPFATQPGERLYRSGDLGRRAAGDVEYLGRIDHQVKVRGFRIELGEIEAALGRHPAVRETAVLARQDGAAEARLVAYVVFAPGEETTAGELRSFAGRSLPEHMVPAAFVALPALPLTANGKLDRRALPAPEEEARLAAGEAYAAPRSWREKVLAGVWERVLRVERAGLRDNFFSLGGDSILSLQVISQCREAGLVLTPKQIFDSRDLAELAEAAALLDRAAPEAEEAEAGVVPLTPIQRWFFARRLPDPHHWNQALLLTVPAGMAPAVADAAVAGLLATHSALRLRFLREDGAWRQEAADLTAETPFTDLDLSALPRDARRGALEAAAARVQTSLDLERGPLVRVARFRLGSGEPDRLLFVVHHLAVDGVSWRILLEDFHAACRQAAQGEPVRLPRPSTGFTAWAARLAGHARSPEVLRETAFWRGVAAGAPAQLPADGPGGANTAASARTLGVALEPEETAALLHEVPRAYRTQINDVLLTAVGEALCRWLGSRSVLVDLESHGREALFDGVDLSRTVGWFTAVYPVRLAPGEGDPGRALRRTKEQLRAIPAGGLGFGLLRFLAGREAAAELEGLPSAQVSFNYLGQLDAAVPGESGLGAAPESSGAAQSPQVERAYPLEIIASVSGGRLQLSWVYSESLHRRETIARLADDFLASLRSLIAHCLAPEAGGFSPSDFPLARIDQESLDRLLGDEAAVEDLYPLSPLQGGILVESLVAGDPEIYFEQLGYRLQGPLDAAAFREAWRTVLARHPVLRTSFLWEGLERPLQMVRRGVELAWVEEDWRHQPEASRQEALEAFLRRDRRTGFDLARPPLTRFALLRLAEEEHFFVWSHHHLLLDGWCLGLLVQEVFQLYRSGVEGRQVRLEPRRPYRDYIAWLERQDLAAAERFWRERLAGISGPTPLTVDRPAAGPREAAPGEEDLLLPVEESAALDAFARSRGLTPSTLFHGAWALLLARYAARSRVVFGSVVAGRPPELAQAAEMVGLFINTLPVPVEVRPEQPAGPWLEALQSDLAGLRQFEHSPLARVQAWSGAPAGLPLFESLLVFENYQRAPALPSAEVGLRVADVRFFESTETALTLAVGPGREILLHAEYDRRRFDAATVRRLLGHLRTLLGAMVAAPERALADLPLLTPAEERQLLADWNATARALPAAPVHRLFAAVAARQPEAPAVVSAEGALSYGELDRAANRLAWRLRRLGVGPEVLVGICLERSPELAVAILAVLKAGGAYLPLDPAYPAERLAFLIADAGLAWIVSRAPEARSLPEGGAPVVRLDAEDLAGESDRDPGVEVDPAALAYALYTSGSTGRPKGVLTPHGALTNYACDMVERFGLRGDDRILQFAPLSFDVLVEELIPTWLAGAAVVLAEPAEIATCAGLQSVLARHRVTGVELPATFWQEWVHELSLTGAEPPASLRFVLVGCDRPTPERVAEWRRFGRTLIHVFGLTETTITTTLYRVEPDGADLDLPIGRPVANARIYVVDAGLRPVPIGVPGELLIGGAGLGRGYLGRPALTAERFTPDPWGAAGERLYRAGDLARYRADGNVDFLGRIDDQVKVRGFRIEPGEVEAVLRRHPGVGDVVVMARGETPGDRALAAFVTAAPGAAEISARELKAHVAASLPDYMVPSSVALLEKLPLTRHGKVDRQALAALAPAALASDRTAEERRPAAPRTPVEEMMAGIWADVLGLGRVGIHDSFFDLGGHSLLATRLISRIRRAFGVELPLRSLFERPALADLSRAVEESLRAGHGTVAPPLAPAPRPGDLPLSFAQERLWFLDQLEPDSPFYNMPAALRLHGPLQVPALRASLAEIVRRHEALRTGFGAADGRPVPRIAAALRVPLPVVDLADLPAAARESEAERLATAEAHRPFRLAAAPLLRAALLRMAAEDHLALFTMHHIVSDAWSIGVLVREIGALYQASLAGRPSPLPELPVQYADFAAWQRQWLQGEVLERQLDYWRGRLAGGLPALQLPTDRPRPAVQSFRGSRRDLVFAPELRESLSALGRAEGATLFMTLLAAFQALLSRLTGQEDLTVGSPVASRDREELEGLIGFFLNTLVLRGDLSGDPSFRELLGRARETALGAYAHQDVPFERLVDELQPERDLSRAPLFQVMLVLQNAPMAPLVLEGLTLSPFAVEVDTAKFDLTLSLEETAHGLAASLEYRTDLFDASTADRLLDRFGRLLAGAVDEPRRPIAELPILSAAERCQLLEERSPAGRSFPVEAPLHRLFERQAALRPQAPAVVCEDRSLTYGELNAQANRVARRLVELGVAPGSRVGLCLERDLELVVSLLAVLKAGCAYVPLDGSLPAERLAFLLADSGVEAVVTQESQLAALPATAVPVLCLEREALAACSDEDLGFDVLPEQAAYVIYTSGSTGRPKGVVVSHANAVRLFTTTDAWFGFGPDEVWTLFHSYAFDFSVWELWGALLYGGRLVVVPYWVSRSPESFHELLVREKVTVLSQTPSAFRQLMRADEISSTSGELSLRWVVFGGEALELGSLRIWYERHAEDRPRLVNMYGITETTVHVTYRELSAADAVSGTGSRIGVAIPDLQVYVLDRHRELVPEGVAGELCVGGAGLAWGYLGRPELTAERFVPHPFAAGPGERLYRSGDLGRWMAGDLEYLGRIDHQVKVRGFRIELGEIESVLGRHEAVRETVVLARGDSGEARLVAYVVFAPGRSATAGELRDFAGRSLPEHMAPSAFVALPALPLTGNGKVDRKALPAPEEDGARLEAGEAYVAPRTWEERVLAEVWAGVLGVERVG
ncbi:MAG TPA: amino acid adenylation domain-containing protein, partial [Thermoanaerobaculia bacterium]|nr:amino acid adenylation domain-containing protein [Thermoanaerobaculia bacterium]